MAELKFKRGQLAALQRQNIDDGALYVTTDEGAMYLDVGNQRIRLGDFIPVNTVADLPAAGHAYETAVYYVKTGNILARWDATNAQWIQINKSGVVAVADEQGTSGNVITGIRIDTDAQGQLTLKLTRTSVAASSTVAQLQTDVSDLTTKVNTIQGTGEGSITKAVNDAKAALLGDATTYTTLGDLEDALATVQATANAADALSKTNQSSIGQLNTDLGDLEDRVEANEGAIADLNGPDTNNKSVAYAVKQEADARAAADTALSNRVTATEAYGARISQNETDIGDLKDVVGATANAGLRKTVADNTAAIALLNNPDATVEGSVKKAVADGIASVVAGADTKYDTLKEIADWILNDTTGAADMANDIAQLQTDLEDLDDRVTALDGDNGEIAGIKTRLTTAESDIDTLEAAIATLNANDSTTGSVDYKIKQALSTTNSNVSQLQTDLSDLAERVSDNEDAIALLNNTDNTVQGSVAYAVKQEADARSAEDTRLAGLISTNTTNIGSNTQKITQLQTDVSDLQTALTWIEFN